MKIKIIPFLCLALLLVSMGNIFADDQIHVVHKPDTSRCIEGNGYIYYDLELYTCSRFDGTEYECGPIQKAYNATIGSKRDTIIVCPGEYYENVELIHNGNSPFTIKSKSNNPADTIIHAKDPTRHVFNLRSGRNKTITGFTITGATAGAPFCMSSYNPVCNPQDIAFNPCECFPACCPIGNPSDPDRCQATSMCNPSSISYSPYDCGNNDNPLQPCAGIRVYGISGDNLGESEFGCMLSNNIITENNTGIIIKDTAYNWPFGCYVENNEIHDNLDVGVHLRYGDNSYIRNNDIHHNPTGISLVDTWNQEIRDNIIEDNDIGIIIGTHYYSDTYNHKIYHNNFIGNNISRKFTVFSTDFNSDFQADLLRQINGDGWFPAKSIPSQTISYGWGLSNSVYDPWRTAWEVENGEYSEVSPSLTKPAISLRPTYTQDMTIEVKAKDLGTNEDKNFFIVFAYDNTSGFAYWAGAKIGDVDKWLIQRIKVATGDVTTLESSPPENIQSNTWYNLKVVISGDTVELSADNVYKISYTFSGGIPRGRIGLGGRNNHAHFDNFSITSENQAWDTNYQLNNWYEPTFLEGNYWDDYLGLDAYPFDGIGNTQIPHPVTYYDNYPFMYSYGWLCSGDSSKYPVKNSSSYYFMLQSAFDLSLDGNTIQSRDIIFAEDLLINQDKLIILEAGYDCSYSDIIGTTIIHGNVNANSNSGTLKIDSGTLKID